MFIQHFHQLFLNYCSFYMVCYPTHLISVQIKFPFERFRTDINQPNHIPACVQHRVIKLVPNKKSLQVVLSPNIQICKLDHLHIHEYSSILIFAEKSTKTQLIINHISDCYKHRLTKMVPNKSLDIALLFIMHICKLAYLHSHEYSLTLMFW